MGAGYQPDVASASRGRFGHAGLAFVSYSVLAVVLTYPLIRQIGSVVSDLGDPLLNTWILWSSAHAVPFSPSWWNAPAFYPARDVMAFSEHLSGLTFLSTPVVWLTGNPVLGYNLLLLVSFALSGLAAYLLCFELTGHQRASWIAGLAYGFCPYRIAQLGHLQILSSYWMPVGLLGLHLYFRDRRTRWLALFGLSCLLQGLSSGYYLLFFPVLIGMWLLWFQPAAKTERWNTLAAVGGAWALAMLPLVPLLLRYRDVHDRFGLARSLDELTFYSADLMSLLTAPSRLGLWGRLNIVDQVEGELFPGMAVVVLVLLGLATAQRVSISDPPAWPTVRQTVAVVSGLFLLAGVCLRVTGPWEVTVFGVSISVTRMDNLAASAALGLLALLLTSSAVRAARARYSLFGFYVLAAGVLWILALGPTPSFLGTPIIDSLPYRLLMVLPGYVELRVPARFWMLAVLCLSVAAGLAVARIAPSRRRWSIAVVAVMAAGILADTWMREMRIDVVPARSAILEQSATGPVLELPLGSLHRDVAAMYRGIFHGQPVVNGYSGFFPPHYPALAYGLARFDDALLARLSTLGVRNVRVDRRADADGAYARYVSTYPGAELVTANETEALYHLPQAEARELDPVWWTSSERRIRWPEWDQARRDDGYDDSSPRSSKQGPYGWSWMRSGRLVRSHASWT